MKKVIKLGAVVEAAELLERAKFDKLEKGEMSQMVKALRAIKEVSSSARELKKLAEEKMKTPEFEVAMEKARRFASLTAAEQSEVNLQLLEHNARVNECMAEDLNKEVRFELSALSESAIERLTESNDFTLGQVMTLQDVLCK